ncbi:MAG: TIGR04282 family arsenosugar biosynthesis glycosyltransferase [Acidobacteria bacterium]|nr:TIGR04282 family arsenosugar biosynthesis glycosyltransferase [Acidobacteriota bacterium]
MRPVIILFARAPIVGQVKTRLIPALGPEGAAMLHVRLVRHALHHLEPYGDLELHTDIRTEAWPEFRGPRVVQAEGDLGYKMFRALEQRGHALLVGSDAPAIPEMHLKSLLDSPSEVTLGPADDGGFYAIATRRTHPRMFDHIEWSSGHELKQTLAACHAAGLTTAITHSWFDVDVPQDLERLRKLGIQ